MSVWLGEGGEAGERGGSNLLKAGIEGQEPGHKAELPSLNQLCAAGNLDSKSVISLGSLVQVDKPMGL